MTKGATRLERLPKWAQQEIARLERNLAEAEAKLAAGPEDSRVFADPYSGTPRPLGVDPRIEFRLGDEKIHVRLAGNGIEVVGGDRLAVLPQSGNVVVIEARSR